MCPPWTEFEVDSLSGLVVGRASYGAPVRRGAVPLATDNCSTVQASTCVCKCQRCNSVKQNGSAHIALPSLADRHGNRPNVPPQLGHRVASREQNSYPPS